MPEPPRVLNKRDGRRHPADAIYVGRPTDWGNPFVVGRDGDQERCVQKHRAWLLLNPTLMTRLRELRGHDLVCWCAPKPCHADTLIEFANWPRPSSDA